MKRLLRQHHSNKEHRRSNSNNNQEGQPRLSPSGRLRRNKTSNDAGDGFGGSARADPMARAQRGVSEGRAQLNGASDRALLPTAWQKDNSNLSHRDPLCVVMNGSSPTTVYANRSLPREFMQKAGNSRGVWRRTSNDAAAALYPNLADPEGNSLARNGSPMQVYYFEITVLGSHASPKELSIGFCCDQDSLGALPGQVPDSIGWGTDGFMINGRAMETGQSHFRGGDVLGCGIELGGLNRVFFTWNGAMTIPPSSNTSFKICQTSTCYPAAGFRFGQGELMRANFGLDPVTPVRWPGTDRISMSMAQPGRNTNAQSTSLDSLPFASTPRSQTAPGRTGSPSPYYSMGDLDRLGGPDSRDTRTARPVPASVSSPVGRYQTTSPHAPSNSSNSNSNTNNPSNSAAANTSDRPSFFGVKNHRKSLVDDDPNDVNAVTNEHFNLSSPQQQQDAHPGSTAGANWSNYGDSGDNNHTPATRRFGNEGDPQSASRRDLRRQERAARRARSGEGLSSSIHDGSSSHNPLTPAAGSPTAANSVPEQRSRNLPPSRPEPRSATPSGDPNEAYLRMLFPSQKQEEERGSTPQNPPTGRSATRTASIAVAAGNEVVLARENSQTLLEAARQQEVDVNVVVDLLDNCKSDQEKLQLKLNNALEEADAIENLEELFAVNDGILKAINAAHDVLKREKQKSKKKKSMEGPTIELLVENEDVFSLICMLRAPNEKRSAAALALMKFARENEVLRNEIRSSGGMHSFLTLFRTKGTPKELQITASMAVAYVLPSFVVSSQTSSSVGLRIIECLRSLTTASPTSIQGTPISRDEMVKAASVGVNVLWINAIQPLLAVESAKAESRQIRPALKPSASMRFGRQRGRAGGGMFDQGHESIEIRELTELAVTLITHIARLSSSGEKSLEIGYNIVEQVCEVDAARPIAVREGLLTLLVDWIRSKDVDKVRPAASALRYLISINDKYMAGWIHSQVVNEGAVGEIVKLLNESVGHDVRVAVAEMLSALCVAPHTRAAVVEAKCVNYLVALLYEHSTPASEEMVRYAASALLQLAAGAMVRATALSGNNFSVDPGTPDQQESVITEIMEGWAHGSFVQIAMEHIGQLRSVSVEALRVLSEDTNKVRQTRLQLCTAGAAGALGKVLKDDSEEIKILKDTDHFAGTFNDPDSALYTSVKDVHESLRGLANILEPQKEPSKSQQEKRMSGGHTMMTPREVLIQGCLDVVKSGGLECLIWIASMPYSQSPISENPHTYSVDRMDLLDEACRLLANLSPLLLSDTAAAEGCARWSSNVFQALHSIMIREEESENEMIADRAVEVDVDSLRGLAALARYEPLKIRIVEKSLPKLLEFKTLGGEKNDLSNAASQVLMSLGFTEDEITVQVAGNSPKLLVDWFCLQRALLLQAMARVELRSKIIDMWELPFSDIEGHGALKLMRQISQQSNLSSQSGDDRSDESEDHMIMQGLFENFTSDSDSFESRESILQQYFDVYMREKKGQSAPDSVGRVTIREQAVQSNADEVSLMKPHVYPLNDSSVEREWILSHRRSFETPSYVEPGVCPVGVMPQRIEKLLECCFPSKLLRNDILPFNDLRPQSSFNFRALMMPQRRYFSFRQEGQILTRLCEKHAGLSDTDELLWSLGFTNSTFAGEFVESLVQTLYLCPMITGLSFTRNADWLLMKESETEADGDDGGGLLANLAGSLPPWVTNLTFDNVLNDRDLLALVTILDTMGKLSSGVDEMQVDERTSISVGQSQGKFSSLSVRNSPQVSQDSWIALFKMLGKSGPAKRGVNTAVPLSSLTILDLSGNKLGDELSASVLEFVHDKDSGCNLEQLDLSGNRIGRGTNLVRVLRSYTDYYRYNQKHGVKMVRSGWKSTLHTLMLADNDLFLGQAGLEIFALLKHNALCLRFLDLSNNSLEGDTYQLLASSLLKNTSLCHLNLSGNKFSSPLIDLIMEHITAVDAESGLSFLLFENNTPPLNPKQREQLGRFLRKSRKNAIDRFIKEREKGLLGNANDQGDFSERNDGLELIDETTTNIFRSSFSTHRRRFLSPEIEDSLEEYDDTDNMITVLFSAPLVFADETNKLHPFAKLDFDMERELLWQCMKEASRDIDVSFDNAHHSRLLATLTKRCTCLHYSGHGHPNFLPFEDGMGGPNWLNVQDIKNLILGDGEVAPFKFVFVSACHSGLAGETFASAGVPHVVCCQQEQELKDTAALAFTRSFYLALAVGHTVKESFDQGCKAVRATPNLKDPAKEMEKFVLLPRDGNHDVPVFKAKPVREWPKQPRNQGLVSSRSSRRRGSLMRMRSVMALGAKSSELSTRNMMQEDPSPTAPQFFIGREVDMYYILTALLKMKKRLVNVLGEPGIGRSSLACALCHYINERASTITEIQRIYFIKPKQHGGRNVSCRSLLRQLLDKLQEAGKCRPTDEDNDPEAMLDIICRSLKNDKALIVFDRMETLEQSDDAQELPMILSTLLYDTKQVKVVLTGKHSLGQPSIGGQVEHPYNLGPLNFANTVRLFANLCPHLHTPSERGLFFTELMTFCGPCSQLFPGDPHMAERSREIFSMVGDGIPSKVEKAAYSISKNDLTDMRRGQT